MIQFEKLSDWLTYFENSPRFAMQLGLERIHRIAESLDLLLSDIPIITVAGTNGKGSTVHALQSIYLAAGHRVGVYTSPHIFNFNERITINGKPISDSDLCNIFSTIESVRADIELTYFETATLAAMYYFQSYPVDVIILEVGMGGRLDATNLWSADLAIITTIDYDHEAHLGTSLEQIGFEKAGILRSNQIAIYGSSNPPASIVERAKTLQTNIFYCDKNYQIFQNNEEYKITFQKKTWIVQKPKLQINAIAIALVGCYLLQVKHPSLKVCDGEARLGMMDIGSLFQTPLIGRQQLISGPINLLFDVAHNPQSVSLLQETIMKQTRLGKVYAVFSALKDKNIPKMVDLLTDIVDIWYSAPLDVSRAATQIQLEAAFAKIDNERVRFLSSIEIAFQNAYSHAKEGDLIIIFGSFYVVSAVMKLAPTTRSLYV